MNLIQLGVFRVEFKQVKPKSRAHVRLQANLAYLTPLLMSNPYWIESYTSYIKPLLLYAFDVFQNQFSWME